MAKNEPVPCIVDRKRDTLAEEDSLVENIHRVDLHPLDQYRAIKTLSLSITKADDAIVSHRVL